MPVGPTYGTAPFVRTDPGTTGVGFGIQAGADVALSRDGTPSRVAGVLLIAGAALAALRFSGIRFNVGVSS